jgi:hypothetical protein
VQVLSDKYSVEVEALDRQAAGYFRLLQAAGLDKDVRNSTAGTLREAESP